MYNIFEMSTSTDFRLTGHPETALTANISGSGLLISAPGSLKYITIHDILTSANTALRLDSTTGTILAHAPAGCSNLGASITGGENNAIYNSVDCNVTVTYSKLNI